MNSRQRGAAVVLAAFLAGRLLDRFDLPFEQGEVVAARGDLRTTDSFAVTSVVATRPDSTLAPSDTTAAPSVRTAATAVATTDSSAPIAINRVTAADLERLPGVGPVLAARIVAERETGGLFRDLADLRRVRGIGAKTAARLAPRLRFD